MKGEKKGDTKTVALMKWVDVENAKLSWSSGTSVKSKKKCDPDKDTWEHYPATDVILESKLLTEFYFTTFVGPFSIVLTAPVSELLYITTFGARQLGNLGKTETIFFVAYKYFKIYN